MSRNMLTRSILVLIVLFITAGIVINNNRNEEKIITKNHNDNYLRCAKGVSKDMLYADYWLNGQDSIDEVIMSKLKIGLWNLKYGNTEFWKNINNPENVKYGYTTARCSIRKEPTNEQLPTEDGSCYFCALQISSILLNEPIIILGESEDGEWYYIRCRYCEGWIEKKNIGICDNFQQWKANMEPDNFLLITGNKVILDINIENTETSQMILYMGTRLELVEYEYYMEKENERVPYECYIVKIPVRSLDGALEYKYGFIPVSMDVNVGYLPYTSENLVVQMFKLNGDIYGWGGMFNSRDCSQYVMDIYSLFGFKFARNSAAQADMSFEGYELSKLDEKEKTDILNKVPIGSLLYFNGHIMLYLGCVNDEYYVISATARILENEEVINAFSCMVTPLSVKRSNGNTWLSELSMVKCIR